jgi:transcription termination factor NusA
VVKVVLDETRERIEVVVPDAQLSLAIGRRGQNVRLASQLTGWDIDILTEAEESERRQKEFAERNKAFMEALDIDEMAAQLLTSEGFASVEELAFVPIDELAAIEGFDENTATELQTRAKDYLARIEVVVPDTNNQLSLAIGRRGQNVRLASQLTGWDIDILTESEESERRQADFENSTRVFMEALNVDEVVGQLLASEGFTSVEELALVDVRELAGIEGFDDETAEELQSRAREYLETLEAELEARRKELGVEDALKDVPGITSKMLVKLGENEVKTVEDLAGCATDDLVGWTERKDGGEVTKFAGFFDGIELSREDAEHLIMQARLAAGWITEADLAKPDEEAEVTEDQAV